MVPYQYAVYTLEQGDTIADPEPNRHVALQKFQELVLEGKFVEVWMQSPNKKLMKLASFPGLLPK
jgi:hypothetical protein